MLKRRYVLYDFRYHRNNRIPCPIEYCFVNFTHDLPQPSAKAKNKEDAKALGVHRVPENQKREVYERVRRAVDAKGGICTSHKVGREEGVFCVLVGRACGAAQ